jgi:hypothetical protein
MAPPRGVEWQASGAHLLSPWRTKRVGSAPQDRINADVRTAIKELT